ncbi:MAG: hypothetical protein KGL39_26905 [Patescibacteria group bacterium]|nr:hypothetical protein [Patescibacteria group bacterium]
MTPLDPNNINEFALLSMILLTLEAGEISEGQAARLTGHDRVMLRMMRQGTIDAIQARWKQLRENELGRN